MISLGGDVVFEWPAYNKLRSQPIVVRMINEFNLRRVVFHGCQLGLVSVRNGEPIKKPWAFETTIPEIVSAFEPQMQGWS